MWTKLVRFVLFISIDSGFSFDTNLDYDWQKYKEKFHKKYSTDMEEELRKSNFEESLKLIASHNRDYDLKLTTFTMGLNEFSDMSDDEFRTTMESVYEEDIEFRSKFEVYSMTVNDAKSLPRMVDWRKRNVVSGVKQQGHCGACWAFAAVGAIEGNHAIKHRKLVVLSEQHLLDCMSKNLSSGCNGGRASRALQYVIDNKGISTAKSYPYTGRQSTCKFDKKNIGATISKVVAIQQGSEGALQEVVANIGPVAVSIDGLGKKFRTYKSGIFNEPQDCSGRRNHAILVVGYGDKNNVDYWIIKNSWGTEWGINGYGYMSRNKRNQCSIASFAHFSVV